MTYWPVLSAGVDWITVTATEQDARRRMWRTAHRLLDAESAGEGDRSVWRWKGYEGSRVGSVVSGEREDSCFCQVTGHAASTYWLALLDHGVNVKRLDVQVTARAPRAEWDEAAKQWERIEGDGKLRRRAGWRSRITTKPTGATLYIGSPKSERRLRLYDKHAEDPVGYPEGSWRYEVQARDGLARSLAAGLADRDRVDIASVATVHECFRARGVQPRFRASGGGVLGHTPRARSRWERQLEWLRVYVRPTVARLREGGHGSAVDRVLGMG